MGTETGFATDKLDVRAEKRDGEVERGGGGESGEGFGADLVGEEENGEGVGWEGRLEEGFSFLTWEVGGCSCSCSSSSSGVI